MKFKEIKPGMVIHCPTEEDARALLEHLDNLGYTWGSEDPLTENRNYDYRIYTCYHLCGDMTVLRGEIGDYVNNCNIAITEFSDLIEPDIKLEVKDGNYNFFIDGKATWATHEESIGDIKNLEVQEIPIESIPSYSLNSDTDSSTRPLDTSTEMSAVKVLKWLALASADAKMAYEALGEANVDNALLNIPAQEIIGRITAYEATKKEPEQRFKVGDRVKAKNNLIIGNVYGALCLTVAMERDTGKTLTINSIAHTNDGYLYGTRESAYSWSEEMLEPAGEPETVKNAKLGKSVMEGFRDAIRDAENSIKNLTNGIKSTDSAIDSSMPAVEVLQWLEKYGDDPAFLSAVFGEGCQNYDDIFGLYPAEEVYKRISAYREGKIEPEPVEMEWVNICSIYRREDDLVVCRRELPANTRRIPTEDILRNYIATFGDDYYAKVERICRVKGRRKDDE